MSSSDSSLVIYILYSVNYFRYALIHCNIYNVLGTYYVGLYDLEGVVLSCRDLFQRGGVDYAIYVMLTN